ncbi:MAG: RecQ family ATP-dependent DNA helicase [Puniceicoccaceae bacterium]|nr:MAG: RecQ family ATP-dependent DNA helicase [Puniceicoccaceae bacterium]
MQRSPTQIDRETPPVFAVFPKARFLDLEVDAEGRVHQAATLGLESADHARNTRTVRELLRRLDQDLADHTLLCGHNLLDHDLPVIAARFPELRRLRSFPVLDSLFLSPLAFPKKPYHALVKDKLLASQSNDPLADCRASAAVLTDAIRVFQTRAIEQPHHLGAVFTLLLHGHWPEQAHRGLRLLAGVLGVDCGQPLDEAFLHRLLQLCGTEACSTHLHETWAEARRDPEVATALAYLLAWLPVAGSDSILPPWIRARCPPIQDHLDHLRRHRCTDPACRYCPTRHSPVDQLKRWFGFDSFRPEPSLPNQPGRSLQEAMVTAGMDDESILGILPTGGGKSLAFQLPALYRYQTTGALTIVVSPLQALMRDQVENLVKRSGIHSTAALYGLLTMAERRVLLDELALGAIGLLYLSPEQLRNPSLRRALRNRRIECWVYDEAHCLSKWGHDFRPDYLYVARFIRELAEEQSAPIPSVCCVTATAKRDVQEEIRAHIRENLGHDLRIFDGGAERSNLDYQVQPTPGPQKEVRIHEILTEHLPNGTGSGVVFCATQKNTEAMAEALRKRGWAAGHFHAGLPADEKKQAFADFMEGRTRVIAATNAFGMGVDKPDIRVVIHAETPGSLENYLQEAGRAGRDGAPAACVLLFDQKDLQTQFRLGGNSRLLLEEVRDIWRAIHRADRKRSGTVILTANEIIARQGNGHSLDHTKVVTAVALLEKQGFLRREENRSIIFQGRALVRNLEEGFARIDALRLPPATAALWKAYLQVFMKLPADSACSLDIFAECPQTDAFFHAEGHDNAPRLDLFHFIIRVLNQMAHPNAGLIRKGLLFSAWIKTGARKKALRLLDDLARAETGFFELLRELQPDADGWLPCHLAAVNRRLAESGVDCTMETLARFFRQWEQDARQLHGQPPRVEVRAEGRELFRIRLIATWQELLDGIRCRHAHLATILDLLIAKADRSTADAFVEFSEHDLAEAFEKDLALRADPVRDPSEAILGLLTFAHQTGLLDLQNGKALITSAMTLVLNKDKTDRPKIASFTKGDFAAMAAHYTGRILQIHIMAEYARTATRKVAAHIGLIADYFRLSQSEFARRYLKEDQEHYRRATSIESFHAIVDQLRNPAQQAVVASPPDKNLIVLAGPGSGKTRVIVHRCAYLLQVERLRAYQLLVLCFNRHTCLDLRRRIYALAGEDCHGVTIATYHGLALRLLGRSLVPTGTAGRESAAAIDFKAILHDATRWLRGEAEVTGADPENLRDLLLGDIRYILVDEYQDIDEAEYNFLRALAGIDLKGDSRRPHLLVVGDDDQSIYGFKGANVAFIRRYCEEYQAERHELLHNYRSSAAIIKAANHLIAHNHDRMKALAPIRIDPGRTGQPAGGRWHSIDPVLHGRVHCLRTKDAVHQTFAAIGEIERLKVLHPNSEYAEFAVLARRRQDLDLVRALLEARGLPRALEPDSKSSPSPFRLRPVARWLRFLESHRDEDWAVPELVDRLHQFLDVLDDPWSDQLVEIASECHGLYGAVRLAVPAIRGFFCDALGDQRRQGLRGPGIRLRTVHGAKGLEFRHVLLLDGGWPIAGRPFRPAELEEERRVYYVGMTRAAETLTVLRRADVAGRFSDETIGEDVFLEDAPAPAPEADLSWSRHRFTSLGFDDLFLSYASIFPPETAIHRHLADLKPGDRLNLVARADQLVLCHPEGYPVARLSKSGAAKWGQRLECIDEIRVLAMVERRQSDGEGVDFKFAKCERWELPLCEIRHLSEEATIRPGGAAHSSDDR